MTLNENKGGTGGGFYGDSKEKVYHILEHVLDEWKGGKNHILTQRGNYAQSAVITPSTPIPHNQWTAPISPLIRISSHLTAL
jgi:hypothetical protein